MIYSGVHKLILEGKIAFLIIRPTSYIASDFHENIFEVKRCRYKPIILFV